MSPRNPRDPRPEAIARAIRTARRVMRLERMSQRLVPVFTASALVLAVCWAAARMAPSLAPLLPWVVAALVLSVLGVAAWNLLRPIGNVESAAALDRRLGLPESTVSATELSDSPIDPRWKDAQRNDTADRIAGGMDQLKWRPSGRLGAACGVFVLLAAAVLLWPGDPKPLHAEEPGTALRAESLEEIFEDWELANEQTPDPLLEELLEAVKPLREQLHNGELGDREMLLQLGRIEDRLAEMRDQLAAESLAPFAPEMANTLQEAGGMDALTSALRERDYQRAAEAADAMTERFSNENAEMPEGLDENSTRERFEELSQTLADAGHHSASEAMRSFSDAGESMSRGQLREALSQTGDAMRQQASRDRQRDNLDTQRQQLAMCKGGMGEEPGEGGESMMPGLAENPDAGQPGTQAGTASDPNRSGEVKEALAPAQQEAVTGQVDPSGETETVRFLSPDAPETATISRDAEAMAHYEKLSRQAVEDESLPIAHRMTIRRYFERIRPASEPSTSQ